MNTFPWQRRNPLYGWKWFHDGWRLFRGNSALWLSLMAALFFINIFTLAVPLLGALVFFVTWPIWQAGLLLGAKKQIEGGELEIQHLFAGFKSRPAPLARLGLLTLTLTLFVFMLLLTIWHDDFTALQEIMASNASDTQVLMEAVTEKLMLPALVGTVLLLPVLMGSWFAPALVLFDGIPPGLAMLYSLRACVSNTWPFLLYGLVLLLADFLLSLALGLFVQLIAGTLGTTAAEFLAPLLTFPIVFFFMALLVGSIYGSFLDVFHKDDAAESAQME